MAGGKLAPAVVYDTGALLAAERTKPDLVHLHDRLTAARLQPLVPVAVLAQAWRGGPQHRLSRLLKGCRIMPDDERVGRAAGSLCGAAGTNDVVDAIVVVTAAARAAMVVTSDPADLLRLAQSVGLNLRLFPV